MNDDRAEARLETATEHLRKARAYRAHGDWAGVLRELDATLDGLYWAASVHPVDVLADAIAELEAASAANPKGWKQRRAGQLLEQAGQLRAKLELQANRTPRHSSLQSRLHSLLLLLVYADDSVNHGNTALEALARVDAAGDVTIDLARRWPEWSRLLGAGYDEGYEAFVLAGGGFLRDAQPQIERQLKSVAAQLVTAGAEVRGLSTDAIPMVAFALLHAQIPLGADASATAVSEERVNDALLRMADSIAEMPTTSRPVFVDAYRLAIVLGVAQRYAEQLSLSTLSLA